MDFLTLTTLIALLVFITLFIWKEFLKTSDDRESEKVGELRAELEREKSEKNELIGKGKQIQNQLIALQEQDKSLQEKLSDTQKKLAHLESEKEQRTRDYEKGMKELENSRQTLEDEKKRIRREDEERLQQEEENRNRIWNEHEMAAITHMKEICQKSELNFPFYENTNLPETFDGSLKPDFLVEFLGQYLIFDAKMSHSSNLKTYIDNQVKSTVKKIQASKNREEIYPTIFFVVPTMSISELNKTAFYEDGLSFFVITTESFEPILSSYKKIANYDLAESFDPQERENIVNLIAGYDQHIRQQNAANILSSISGLKAMSTKETLNKDLTREIENRRKTIPPKQFKPTDFNRLVKNPTEQIEEIKRLVTPKKAEMAREELEEAQTLFEE